MNNLSSYCGLLDAKIRASDKDLPVQLRKWAKEPKWSLMTSLIIVEVYFGILLQNKNTTPGQPACQFALLPVSFFSFFFQITMSKILNFVQKSVSLILEPLKNTNSFFAEEGMSKGSKVSNPLLRHTKAELLQLNHIEFICRINFTNKKVGNKKTKPTYCN